MSGGDFVIRVAVCGLDAAGMHHVEALALRRDVDVVAGVSVADSSTRAERYCTRLFADWRDLLATSEFELLIVSGPLASRADAVEAGLAAGRHVLVDNPMTLSRERYRALCEAAEAAGVTLTVFNSRASRPDFFSAFQIAKSGQLGELRGVLNTTWCRMGGKGARFATRADLLEEAADPLLELHQLVDQLPEDVRTTRWKNGYRILLEFEDGLQAAIEVVTDSVVPFETGWVLRGTDGGYRDGRCYRREATGEIVDAPVAIPDPIDPYAEVFSRVGNVSGVGAFGPDARYAELLAAVEASAARDCTR